MGQPNGRNDRVDKVKEAIENTQENIENAERVLSTQSLDEDRREQIESTNANRRESLDEFKQALRDEFRA